MVRMVHMIIFHEMGWGISDEKKELGTKNKVLEGSKFSKIRFEAPSWSFEGKPKDKLTLKIF